MTAPELTRPYSGSFLLELLRYAGWQLRVRGGGPATIHAARDGVELDVTRATLPEAAGVTFALAMRSGRNRRQTEEG